MSGPLVTVTIDRGVIRWRLRCSGCVSWDGRRWTYARAVELAHRHAAAHKWAMP